LADFLAYTWCAAKHQRRAITVPVRLIVPPTKAVTNAQNETVFSFRIPPADVHIDFTKSL
jgi:hypothetical protein